MNEQRKKTAQALAGGDFVRGVIMELRRVTWPTRDEWISATILTVALVIGIGLFTFVVDQLFGWLFNVIHPATAGVIPQ
ncbi:MAG: preprotein translocase subunit SecE [Candidatus Eremiobacteraeota bacterium]|nr:preprotein translocase subunit SecE [Candidatus Eremiobacteraeota bacterium]